MEIIKAIKRTPTQRGFFRRNKSESLIPLWYAEAEEEGFVSIGEGDTEKEARQLALTRLRPAIMVFCYRQDRFVHVDWLDIKMSLSREKGLPDNKYQTIYDLARGGF